MFTNLVFISPPTSQFGPSRSDNPLSHNRLEGLATGRPTIQNPGSADSGDWIYSRVGRSLTRYFHLVPRDGASFPGHETIGKKTMAYSPTGRLGAGMNRPSWLDRWPSLGWAAASCPRFEDRAGTAQANRTEKEELLMILIIPPKSWAY